MSELGLKPRVSYLAFDSRAVAAFRGTENNKTTSREPHIGQRGRAASRDSGNARPRALEVMSGLPKAYLDLRIYVGRGSWRRAPASVYFPFGFA